MVKNPPANAGDTGDSGSIPGLGRSPGVGNGNPPQYSCWENPMDRAWGEAAVHGGHKESYTHKAGGTGRREEREVGLLLPAPA